MVSDSPPVCSLPHIMFWPASRTTDWPIVKQRLLWGGLVILPIVVQIVTLPLEPWISMWSVAFAIYFSCKLFTLLALQKHTASCARVLGYLLLWPGMNAQAFLSSQARVTVPTRGEWLAAIGKCALGCWLIAGVASRWTDTAPWFAGWIAIVGLALLLHFGLFHLLSLAWRTYGIAATAIMQSPALATSVGDFWSKRWNLAFHELAQQTVFRPLAKRWGARIAVGGVFLASGLIHEWVITVPVRAGWGGPTMYFLLQAVGVFVGKSQFGQRAGLNRGTIGRAFCALITIAPLGLLFPQQFIVRAILPTLHAAHLL